MTFAPPRRTVQEHVQKKHKHTKGTRTQISKFCVFEEAMENQGVGSAGSTKRDRVEGEPQEDENARLMRGLLRVVGKLEKKTQSLSGPPWWSWEQQNGLSFVNEQLEKI